MSEAVLRTDDHVTGQNAIDAAAILRVARELREIYGPLDDPEAHSVMEDVVRLERVGRWLGSTRAVSLTVPGSSPTNLWPTAPSTTSGTPSA